jgi:hypothetical protein
LRGLAGILDLQFLRWPEGVIVVVVRFLMLRLRPSRFRVWLGQLAIVGCRGRTRVATASVYATVRVCALEVVASVPGTPGVAEGVPATTEPARAAPVATSSGALGVARVLRTRSRWRRAVRRRVSLLKLAMRTSWGVSSALRVLRRGVLAGHAMSVTHTRTSSLKGMSIAVETVIE